MTSATHTPGFEIDSRLVLDALPALVSYIDRDYRYRLCNLAYENWFRRTREETIGHTMSEVLGEAAFLVLKPRVDRALAGERTSWEARVPYRDGGERDVHIDYIPDRDAQGQVRGFFVLVHDIGLSKATERRLDEANAALREADARKDEFLATLSHELRNPLAPIRQSIAVLKRPDAGESAARHATEVIDRQSQHMSLLLDDLLDVTRISRGTLKLRLAPSRLEDIVASAVEVVSSVVRGHGHAFVVDVQPKSLVVNVDAVRLSQVLSNLLLNAAKYTDAGGVIQLLVRSEGGQVSFRVIDTGIGISADVLPRVFDMFTQAPTAIGRSQGGLGVGLALVRAIVQLHGGTVEAHSAGEGRGSEFVVNIPLTAAAADSATAAAPAPHVAPASEKRPLKVLVADDNHDAAETLQMILSMDGHDVHVRHDGQAALDAIQALGPDVAILDIGMPLLSGLQVAEKTRSASWGRKVRLIALSGWGQEEDQRKSAASGFDHHLTKPVDPETLQPLMFAAGEYAGR